MIATSDYSFKYKYLAFYFLLTLTLLLFYFFINIYTFSIIMRHIAMSTTIDYFHQFRFSIIHVDIKYKFDREPTITLFCLLDCVQLILHQELNLVVV